MNFAPWTLKSHEICLLGIKGTMGKYKIANNIRGLVEAERTKHSKKPNEVRERIVNLFGNVPKIELFAREHIQGWHVWGNEVDSEKPYSEEDYEKSKELGLNLDNWDDYVKYYELGGN